MSPGCLGPQLKTGDTACIDNPVEGPRTNVACGATHHQLAKWTGAQQQASNQGGNITDAVVMREDGAPAVPVGATPFLVFAG